jgi:hypothetical protein
MLKVTYIEYNGTAHLVEVAVGLSVMRGAVNNKVPGIDGQDDRGRANPQRIGRPRGGRTGSCRGPTCAARPMAGGPGEMAARRYVDGEPL